MPLKLDLPTAWFADRGLLEGTAEAHNFTTDWQGAFWYAMGAYIVEVRIPEGSAEME